MIKALRDMTADEISATKETWFTSATWRNKDGVRLFTDLEEASKERMLHEIGLFQQRHPAAKFTAVQKRIQGRKSD